MNAHVIQFAERQILSRASLIELRDARRLLKEQGNTQAADRMMTEIKRRLTPCVA